MVVARFLLRGPIYNLWSRGNFDKSTKIHMSLELLSPRSLKVQLVINSLETTSFVEFEPVYSFLPSSCP
jgi:hypothetical protein